MVLVPLGVSMNSWTRSIDPKSKSRSATGSFTDDTGSATFTRVGSTSHGGTQKLKKLKLNAKSSAKLVSPVQQVLEQTKEKEKLSDAPDTVAISYNIASTSTASSGKKKTAKTKPKKKKTATPTSTRTAGSTIKRLKMKRNSQSKIKLGTSKKSPGKKRKK